MDINSKRTLFVYLLVALITIFFTLTQGAHAQESADYAGIFITEALPNPVGNDSGQEFIEIYNRSDNDILLDGVTVDDRTGNGTYTFPEGSVITANAYIALIQGTDFTFALNNTGDDIFLRTPSAGELIDTITYTRATEGLSWDRQTDTDSLILADPTPGEARAEPNKEAETSDEVSTDTPANENPDNTINPEESDGDATNDALVTYSNIIITEALANPIGTDADGEFIELYNPNAEEVSLENWTLEDASATPRILSAKVIAPEGYITLTREDFTFALNNSGEESVTLRDPNTEVRDTITFTNAPEGSAIAKETLEPYTTITYTETPTPGTENIFTTLNEESEEGVDTIINEELVEDSPEVIEEDESEEIVESDNETENAVADISITEIYANPTGSDTAGEYIEIYNDSDTDANLTGWTFSDSSASGSYTLPENTIIEGGAYMVFFRSAFSFALNNSGEESVTLTRPDESIASSVTFIAPDEGYTLNIIENTPTPSVTLTPNTENITSEALQCEIPKEVSSAQEESEITEEAVIENILPTDIEQPNLILSEILPNPIGTDADGEFIEIYNPTDSEANLEGWILNDASTNGRHILENTEIASGTYIIIPRTVFSFALNNSGEESVTLTKPGGTVAATVTFDAVPEGSSHSFLNNAWQNTTTPTPNAKNIITAEIIESVAQESSTAQSIAEERITQEGPFPPLILTEIFANPEGVDTDTEFIEIYNPNAEIVNIQGWIITDATASGSYTLPEISITPNAYLAIYREDSRIALNNSGDETVTLQSPDEVTVDTFTYNGAAENVSHSRNLQTDQWQETATSTPGAENIFTATENSTDSSITERVVDTQSVLEILEAYPQIIITEILPNPEDESPFTEEFIELYNPNQEALSLEGWVLTDASASGKHVLEEIDIIEPESYLVIERTAFGFALNNSGDETLTLTAPNDVVKDTITYTGSTRGTALAKKALQENTKLTETITPTPGSENIFTTSANDDVSDITPQETYPDLILTELLANPDDTTGSPEEYIEIFNPADEIVNLAGWTIKDASKSGSHTFPSDTENAIDPGEYKVILRSTYGFALNNSGEEIVTLLDPRDNIKSTTTYTSASKGTSYGWTGNKWRFSQTQTPGETNVFGDELVITDIDVDNTYKDVSTEFEVDISGADKDDVKIRWDFGNGKSSSKEDATHKYKEKDTYIASVTVTSETESVSKQFEVEITSYPKRKIDIEKIMANPEGKDSGVEYIVITNNDKKKVKLKNWSIATGKDDDSMRNHPFKKSITLKKGESKIITKKHSAISLNNSAGIVELRDPSGRAIDTISYDYTVAKTIPENALYEKVGSQWLWSNTAAGGSNKKVTLSDLSEQEQEKIIARALANMESATGVNLPGKKLDTNQEIIPTNFLPKKKKSLWQKIKQKAAEIFAEKETQTGRAHNFTK